MLIGVDDMKMMHAIESWGGAMRMSLISLGAGLYWASMTATQRIALTSGSDIDALVQTAVAFLIALLAFALSPYLTHRHLAALSVVATVFNAINVAVCVEPDWFPAFLTWLAYLGSPCLMLLWGVQFAGASRAQAFSEVSRTALVALLVHHTVLTLMAADDGALLVWAAPTGAALSLVSSCILVAVCKTCPVSIAARDFAPEAKKPLAWFVLSRVLLGFTMGMLVSLGMRMESTASWPVVPCVLAALCCLLFLVVPGFSSKTSAILPLVPVAAGAVFPALTQPDGNFAWAFLYSSVWFAWIVMSSVQLSELKYEFGTSELTLAFGEKALILFAMVAGRIFYLASLPLSNGSDFGALWGCMFTVVMVACCYAGTKLLQLSSSRDRESIVREVVEDHDDRLDYIYQTIASDHGLSERETEIFGYLAQGHTRAYISNLLCIAPGTVKAHIGHIYKKLGCHTKEEVFALVGRYKSFNE